MLIADGKIRMVKVGDLRAHELNRRTITTPMFLKLRKSIREDPELLKGRPVLALIDGRIIGGRFRFEAAKEEGHTSVPVFALDVDPDRALEIMLRDNANYGDDDQSLIEEIVYGLNERGRDLDLTGLPSGDIRKMLANVGKGNPADAVKDDALPDVPKRAKSKRGQVYRLGPHRIMCGDSTSAEDVATLMDGDEADFLFTSPPYNVDVAYSAHDDESVDWSKYSAFLRSVIEAWVPVIGEGRAIGWNVGVSHATHHFRQQVLLEELGLPFVRQWIWRKVGISLPTWHFTADNPRVRFLSSNWMHEVVSVHAKAAPGKGRYRSRLLDEGPAIDTLDGMLEHDVFDLHQSSSTREIPAGDTKSGVAGSNLDRRAQKAHPAVYPVRLPAMFMHHLSAPGEICVDPFAGTGSTLIAAEKLGRRGYMMELDPAYVDVARDRWEAYTA